MRITILALGSRGDVQPFVALALALQQRGHAVRIAAPEDYAFLVEDYGLPFDVLGGLIREQMDMERVAAMLDGAGNPLRYAAETLPQVVPIVGRLVADAWHAAEDADALVVSTLGAYPGLSVAEKCGAPIVARPLSPPGADQRRPAREFPCAAGLAAPARALQPDDALSGRPRALAAAPPRPQPRPAADTGPATTLAGGARAPRAWAGQSRLRLQPPPGAAPAHGAAGYPRHRLLVPAAPADAGSRTPRWSSSWRTARRPSTLVLAAISRAARPTP